MSRAKKLASRVLNLAEKRKTGLISIDPLLDLGNGKTLAAYTAKITAATTALDAYDNMARRAACASPSARNTKPGPSNRPSYSP